MGGFCISGWYLSKRISLLMISLLTVYNRYSGRVCEAVNYEEQSSCDYYLIQKAIVKASPQQMLQLHMTDPFF